MAATKGQMSNVWSAIQGRINVNSPLILLSGHATNQPRGLEGSPASRCVEPLGESTRRAHQLDGGVPVVRRCYGVFVNRMLRGSGADIV